MSSIKRHSDDVEARGFGEVDELAVCLVCVHDAVLREELRPDLNAHRCTFCGAVSDEDDTPVAVDFEQFMRVVMGGVRFLYWTVEDSGMPYDSEDAVYVGGDVVDKATVAHEVCFGDVTDDVLNAITDAITEDEWTPALGTAGPTRPDQRLFYGWDSLCEKVKYQSRFVFLSPHDPAAVHPDDIGALELLRHLEQIIARHGMRRAVPAGRRFWRGRPTDDPGMLVTWANAAQLGSPPRNIASSNRFSPAGISMFYGSDAPDTVLAEIRTHGTGSHAVVGAFETARDLALLDLVDLPPLPSVYTDAGRRPDFFDLAFLRGFVADLVRPVVPDDRIHIEYVPTQIVTEYLRLAAADPVDGILFRSARNGGVNVVLFCDADACVDTGTPTSLRPQEKDSQGRFLSMTGTTSYGTIHPLRLARLIFAATWVFKSSLRQRMHSLAWPLLT